MQTPAINTMAKTKTAAPAGNAEARALIDLPELGVQAGGLIQAEADVVAGLVAAGRADDHPEAVAYAKALASEEPAA